MREEPLELSTSGGRLSGTLVLPDGKAPWPVVMMIAGSGPTDRDGNSALFGSASGPMRRLAHALAGRGLASFRYDKRGVGASLHPGLREDDLRFRHLVDDAVGLARALRSDARLHLLILLGHSEGALIAALAAREAGAAALASVAGAGMRASQLLRAQLQGRLPEALELPALAVLDSLEAERTVEDPPEALTLLFRPSVQRYLISWFRYDPVEVLQDLPLPLLLVHGTGDQQVAADHARLLHAARPDARLLLVPDMDHALAVRDDPEAGLRKVAEAVAELVRSVAHAAA